MIKCLKNILIFFAVILIAYIALEAYLFAEVASIKNIDKQFDIAVEYYKKGNYIKSTKHFISYCYTPFAFSEPDILPANKAAFWASIGNDKKIIETLEKSLETYSDSHLLNMMLGVKHLEDKNYSEAEKYIIKSATYGKITSYTYAILGDVYLKFDEPKRAVAAYTKSTELVPQLKTEKERAVRINKTYLDRAEAYRQMGDYKNALKDYEFLLKQKSNPCITPARVYYLASICRQKLKDYNTALFYVDKAISLNKKPHLYYLMQKACIYFDKKEYNKADLYLKEALKLAKPEEKQEILEMQTKMTEYKKKTEQTNSKNKK